MLDIAVCEDNPQELRELQLLLEKELPLFFPAYTLHVYISGQDFCQDLENGQLTPQIAFLDIVLEETSGLEIARALRSQELDTQLIFITSSREYVMESYYYQAAYYILKPVTRDWIHQAIARVSQTLQSQEDYLLLKQERDELRIPQSAIYYVETFGNKTFVHTPQKIFSVYKPLKQIAEELNPEQFLVIQRGILTNMDYIDSMQNNLCTLKNGQTYSLSRKNLSALKEKYFDYLFQKK